MTYRVRLTAGAKRQLAALPERFATAVAEFMVGPLAEDPRRVSKPLHAPFQGRRGARRGDFRVILRVENETVIVERIEHRSTAYRAP